MHFKKIIFLFVFALTLPLYQNCSARHEAFNLEGSESLGVSPDNLISIAAFEKTLFPLTQNTNGCATCHGVSQQPLHSLANAADSHAIMIDFGLVDLVDPANSQIVVKIRNGHQAIPDTVADEMEIAIQDWADEIVAKGGTIGNSSKLEGTFSSIHTLVLQPKCLSCHDPNASPPDLTDYLSTLNSGSVIPGDFANSTLYTECASGDIDRKSVV